MSDDNMGMNAEYVMVCEKCGSKYPMGTSYCTNPLCRANLAIYGKIIKVTANLDVDAACKKIEQMMGEVMSALSGKSYEAEKRPKYQNGFMRIMESARTAKSDSALQNNLQQAEQWKEACLNEISLLGENLESVRAQAKERISRARETVMAALTGKRKAQEKRKEYEAQYDALWTTVSNSFDSNEIKNCAMRAENLAGQFLSEISQMPKEDPQYEAKLQSAKQQAQNRIDAASEAILKALSQKENGDQFSNKYTAGFKNISVRLQQCQTLEEVNNCAAQAEAIRDSNLREIQGMKDKTENGGTTVNGGTTSGTTKNGGTTGGTTVNGGTTGGTTDNGGTTGGTTVNGGTTSGTINTGGTIGGTGGPIDPQYAAQLQREKQRAQKRINAAMDKVLKALSKKKYGDQYREKYAVGFKNISAQMQQCQTLEEVNAYAVQAEALRDSDLIEIKGMKNKFGVGKSILLVLLILFVLGFIEGIISSVSNLSSNSSQGSGNSSAGTGKESENDNNNGNTGAGNDTDDTNEGNWEENVLMEDHYTWSDWEEFYDWAVLGSDDWVRSDITSIIILDTLDSEAADSWDVSEAQDGSVKAWVEESGSSNILYIAGDGGVRAPENCNFLFAGYAAETIEFGTAFHTDGVTEMYNMFANCDKLSSLDLSGFDTSSVTEMGFLFYQCTELETLDITGFDTSKVTDMYAMFYSCESVRELDVSSFNTSLVTDMAYMFNSCYSLQKLDITGFDTSKVTDMYAMFSHCVDLEQIDMSDLDTSRVTDMSYMFNECSSIAVLDVADFNTSKVTSMFGMFSHCNSLEELNLTKWDTSAVTDMGYMFQNCWTLTELDVTSFNTSNVTNMCSMFKGCSSLLAIDISSFNTSNVTDMSYMFSGCDSLQSFRHQDPFDTSSVEEYTDFMDSIEISDVEGGWRSFFE